MDGSNGNVVSLLERIAARLETMDSRLETMDSRLETMDARIDRMDARLTSELRGLRHDMNRRMDNMITFMGSHHGDHEERIRVLEERVLGKAKG
jgi:division protein CdvB (Snf7/Vps24/ESCRT-III family)